MDKKILLRRPRIFINKIINENDKINKKSMSFKEEIQPEIESLDKEFFNLFRENMNKNQNSMEIFENTKSFSHKHECTSVSIYNMNERFMPFIFQSYTKGMVNFNKIILSDKTIKDYEKFENVHKSEPLVSSQNIFDQVENQLPAVIKFVPKHIIVLQLAAHFKNQMSYVTLKNISCSIKSVSKSDHFNYSRDISPKYEIILYEDNNKVNDLKSLTSSNIESETSEQFDRDNLKDNHKTFDEILQEITPTNVSMMECLMTGKQNLNFSAHCIFQLPKIKEIFPNLCTLDLSYNNIKILPKEIYHLEQLQILNVKNNPLRILEESISNMTSLTILICSFTFISQIPLNLFQCERLEQADLSYNNISFIPNILKSCGLKILNLSGNPIRYFKKSFTKLCLDKLELDDTFIHPIFWEKGEFTVSKLDSSWTFCDICSVNLLEFSINVVAFVKNFNYTLPILMSFCSSLCKDSFS